MSLDALILVVTGALIHALWNFFSKKASGGPLFVWLYGLVSLAVAAPAGVLAWLHGPRPAGFALPAAALASAVLHLVYSLVLQQGYRLCDFSVVYPLARGTGPLFSVIGAILLIGETPSIKGWIGIGAILVGILTIAGGRSLVGLGSDRSPKGVGWGILTGLFVAAYTVVDGWAVKVLGLPPVLFYVCGLALRTALLAPAALRRPQELREQWRRNRRYILAVGALSPLAYTLVLFAMARAPLSYVAPARELSMMIGMLLGAQLLREQDVGARMAGTALMVAGVVMLALA